MHNSKTVYIILLIISASIVCFEVVSTRVSSVIFINNYAFIILSLSILGLGLGGIYSHYKIKTEEFSRTEKVILISIILSATSLVIFIVFTILFNITNSFVYFILLILPFFFAGIIYSQLYKLFAERSFLMYASDLTGAAAGSVGSIFLLNYFGAVNSVLILALLVYFTALIFTAKRGLNIKLIGSYLILFVGAIFLVVNGEDELFGRIPIGKYQEKDFYHVYPDAENISVIEESRWSIHGRSDLVGYTNQNLVKQLFIDGSAGSQMYYFNGNIKNPERQLQGLLLQHSTSIPFLFLNPDEKNSMLVIGPGGGKEILTGLIEGVNKITGVEVNRDFVDLVIKHKNYNGGIYTDFPNIDIQIAEGRNFIKRTSDKYDLIVMALPSTEQLQNIDNLASNENFLLTVESIQDYLKILTTEGRLIITVHNRWELIRLIVTTLYALEEFGISNQAGLNHFIILGEEYVPTLVVKKNEFLKSEIDSMSKIMGELPTELPSITYIPFNWNRLPNSVENILLKTVKEKRITLSGIIENDRYDISPVRDDSPYFYKVNRGIPGEYLNLFFGVLIIGLIFIIVPIIKIKPDKKHKNTRLEILFPLSVFVSIGLGFMLLEVSLFQKMILYLGSPTISLSILLGSLLIGMGSGSFFGEKIFNKNLIQRLIIISVLIIITGIILYTLFPIILSKLLGYNQLIRSVICFILILPFGFMLGIPFPTGIKILKQLKMENLIPWMYGVNGVFSVLGSIAAVIISMTFGFSFTFLTGLSIYLILFLLLLKYKYEPILKSKK